jgi:SPP1 gp7 family putative phage head morphogenesis protein
MKREITAEKPTLIKAPKSPRAIENEMGDFLSFMVEQMAQRFRNQVLDKLNVSTVEKFADIKIEVSRERRVVDRYEERTIRGYEEREFTDAAGGAWTREELVERKEQHPVYRHERFTTEAMASEIRQSDYILSFEDAQTGNFAAILLRLANKTKRKLLKQFDDTRIEAEMRKQLGKLDRKSRMEFYNRIGAKVGIDVKDLIAREGLQSTTNALVLETAQWVKTLRDESLEKFTNNTLFGMSQGESIDTIVGQFDDVVSERKNHARFLARNQVQNYNSITTKIRAQNLGITKAIWRTAGDERVRPSHEDRDGKTFDIAEGLYSSIDGKYLLTGVDYGCRCAAEYLIPTEE